MPRSQDDKNIELLRSLSLTTGNKRCMDCQAIGPVYVVINFGTFVCQTCSGIHREFGHRVKSISMATFTPEEIAKVKRVGNENATRIWLAKWTTAEFPIPESGNERRIREFMKLKYQDKRWFDQNAFESIMAGKKVEPVSHQPVIREEPVVQQAPQQQEQKQQPASTMFWGNDDNVGPIQKTTPQQSQQAPTQPPKQQAGNAMFEVEKKPQKKVDFMALFDNAMKQPAPNAQPVQQPQPFDFFGNVQPQQPQMAPSQQVFGQQPMYQQPQQPLFSQQPQQMYQQQPMQQQMFYQQTSVYQQTVQQPMFQQQPAPQQKQSPQPSQQPKYQKPQPDVFSSLGSYQPKAKPQEQPAAEPAKTTNPAENVFDFM
ncbi:stromal membrane-associated protein, putative [Entamoeba invadens IP1]|uniref:Stromal membrane-associated protein, putative n=1 Tax=Entamoeba invadens IP1 TaxID=370355 RepID=A0A0A1UAF8_ENTIV|nr:stromal membrane-associated protein, putative [Entamoeba invadens IP1]ELP92033.1 stromal membrane-associated protein, putative [Entamoeba invadens IP1]|eukprot:XP_004258804.1 stromal membrane-associated protein, putative [Entamoeba invadens IP1]